MGKVILGGLISSIRGRVGDNIFFTRRGRTYVRKRSEVRENTATGKQKEIGAIFSYFKGEWNNLTEIEKALWEEYAKGIRIMSSEVKASGGIIPRRSGVMGGGQAYLGMNVLLKWSGFEEVRKPPISKNKPPLPKTDIEQYGTYSGGKIKFKVRLSYEYDSPCAVQIWVKGAWRGSASHIAIVPLPIIGVSPIEVTIEKVRNKGKELSLREIVPRSVRIQMRTVAQNGLKSMPTAVYRVRVEK